VCVLLLIGRVWTDCVCVCVSAVALASTVYMGSAGRMVLKLELLPWLAVR